MRACQLSYEARRLRKSRMDPAGWAREKLGFEGIPYRSREELVDFLAEHPEQHRWARAALAGDRLVLDPERSYQTDALSLCANPGRYVLRFPNGSGKTAVLAVLTLWFLDNYPDGAVVTTAGTWSQIRDQLWREIPFWASKAAPDTVTWAADDVQKTGINIDDKWFAIGRTASKEWTFEGIHSQHVLLIFDEAKAIKRDIWDAGRRILRGRGVKDVKLWWIAASTPASPFGPYYEACQSERWVQMKLSAYETAMIGLDEVQDDLEELGEDGPLFWSMDLAEFPMEAEDTVIPLSLLLPCVEGGEGAERAQEHWREAEMGAGIDVARFGGAETCCAIAQGGWVRHLETWRKKPVTHSVGRIKQILYTWGVTAGRIAVDDTGVGGAVTDELAADNYDPIPINHQARAWQPERYADWISEAWFLTRDLARDGLLSIPNDPMLVNQLAGRRYLLDSKNRRKVESKQTMRKEGRPSPDRAEGVIYAVTCEASGATSIEADTFHTRTTREYVDGGRW